MNTNTEAKRLRAYIAEQIKSIRKQSGKTQEEMAAGLKISRSMYAAVEEQRALPKPTVMLHILQMIGKSYEDVIAEVC